MKLSYLDKKSDKRNIVIVPAYIEAMGRIAMLEKITPELQALGIIPQEAIYCKLENDEESL